MFVRRVVHTVLAGVVSRYPAIGCKWGYGPFFDVTGEFS